MRVKYNNHYFTVNPTVSLCYNAEEWDRFICSSFSEPKERCAVGNFIWWDFIGEAQYGDHYQDFKLLEDKYVEKYRNYTMSDKWIKEIRKKYNAWLKDIKRRTVAEFNNVILGATGGERL